MKRRHLVVDTANLLFRTSSAHTKYANTGTPAEQAGLALHMTLNTLKSHFNKVKPDVIALSFEGRNNWRKAYTLSDQCISKRFYKGNRVKDESMEAFFQLVDNFRSLVVEHSAIQCLFHNDCEGDDIFAAYVEHHCGNGDEVYGLSGDKDYVQLLDIDGFTLLNPDKLGADRSKDKKGNLIDAKYFMFEKAFRGDAGDNVMSAYPRVRSSRLEKAYINEYELTNLLNETWDYAEPSTGEIRTMRVGDLYEENQLLMNLRRQPPDIREKMFQTVIEAPEKVGKFSLFHFSKFCGQHGLKKIAENVSSFVPMFSDQTYAQKYRTDTIGNKSGQVDEPEVQKPMSARDKANAEIMTKLRAKTKTLVF